MERKPRYHSATDAEERAQRGGAKIALNQVIVPPTGVGIKTWGAIDYLKTQCKYAVTRS